MNFLCALEHINMVFIKILLEGGAGGSLSKINKMPINSTNADVFLLYSCNRLVVYALLCAYRLNTKQNEIILDTDLCFAWNERVSLKKTCGKRNI